MSASTYGPRRWRGTGRARCGVPTGCGGVVGTDHTTVRQARGAQSAVVVEQVGLLSRAPGGALVGRDGTPCPAGRAAHEEHETLGPGPHGWLDYSGPEDGRVIDRDVLGPDPGDAVVVAQIRETVPR